jgi:hypothetical protein
MPTAGRSPEEWIGQKVLVETIEGREYQVVVRPDGISDWDMVLTEEGVEPNGTAVFFPWIRVMAMRRQPVFLR